MIYQEMPGPRLRATIHDVIREAATGDEPVALLIKAIELFFPEPRDQSILTEMIIDHIFNTLVAAARENYTPGDGLSEKKMDRYLTKWTGVTSGRGRLAREMFSLASRAARERAPHSESRNLEPSTICYICGTPIINDETIDHMWPKSKGGTDAPDNLWKSHRRCEIYKADMAVTADAPFLRMAQWQSSEIETSTNDKPWIRRLSSPKSLLDINQEGLRQVYRLGILRHQEYRCEKCRKPFFKAGPPTLHRREPSRPWIFVNISAYCRDCAPPKEAAKED